MSCVGTEIKVTQGLNALRALARAALPGLRWRHHGIGALQGYVTEGAAVEVRIHIWSPRLIKPGMAASGSIHDHRFDMISHVLSGVIGHEEWSAKPDVGGDYETITLTHARAAESTKFHGPIAPTGQRYFAQCNAMLISAGHTYTFPAGQFHRSTVPAFAVTVVEKHAQRSVPARVLYPRAIPPVMAFGHDLDDTLVAELVAQASDALSATQ